MPIHTNKFRSFARLEVSDEPIINNAGLACIGQLMRIAATSPLAQGRGLKLPACRRAGGLL